MSHVEPERGGRQLEGEQIPAVLPWSAQDEFAGRAMQGMLTGGFDGEQESIDTLALLAYDIAEAMMEQRNKRP